MFTRRRLALVCLSATTLAVAALTWLWLWPSADASCHPDNGPVSCVAQVELDVASLDLEPVLLNRAASLSPDASAVAVAILGPQTDDRGPAAVATFDTRSGNHLHTYVAGDDFYEVEGVAFSPDGTLLAVSYFSEVTEAGSTSIRVFAVGTGELVTSIESPCDFGLGISPDNKLLECKLRVFDLPSGSFVENLSEPRFATISFSRSVHGPTGMQADLYGDSVRLTHIASDRPDSTIAIAGTTRHGDRVHLESTLDGSQLAFATELEHPWWTPLPQRSAGSVVLFDTEAETQIASIDVPNRPEVVAYNFSGSFVAVVDDGFELTLINTSDAADAADAQ